MTRALALATALTLALVSTAHAHPLALGTLTIREDASGSIDVTYRFSGTELRETGAEPELPAQCERVGLETEAPLEEGGVARHARFDCGDGGLERQRVAVRGLEGTGVQILVRVERPDGSVARALLDDTRRELVVGGESSSFAEYVVLGAEHVAAGIDHLLFVLGLFLLVGTSRRLVWTITAFTLGHSVTLALAALGLVQLRPAPVEACIALSVLLLAMELARPPDAPATLAARHPALVAGGFGLLHGLGFATALREAGLPRADVARAVFGFNVGVEIGQLAFVALCVAVAFSFRRAGLALAPARRAVVIGLGGAAVFFLLDRVGSLGAP